MKAVNLLPPDLSGAPKASAALSAAKEAPRGPGAFVILGALALAVLALAGYVLTTNTVKERQTEIAQLTARQSAAERRAAALKPYAEFEQLAQSRLATTRDLAGQRFDWDQALRDFSRALPGDVTIKGLDGSLSGSDSTGASTTQSTADGPSVTLEGCTRRQAGVARMLARLRDMNGVSSVSLSSSTKAQSEAANTVNESSTSDAPCGSGYLPAFKVVVRYGGAGGSAQASGGSSTTSAAASAAQASTTSGQAAATPTPQATASAQASSVSAQSTGSTPSTQGGAQ